MINKEEILRKAKKNSSRKRRLSLIFSLPVSLLSVFTAAVSTFAWYQASSASIEISGESTTTISVAAPEDVSLKSPNLFAYKGNRSNGYTGAITNQGSESGITIADDFVSASTSELKTGNLIPGRKMTFAVRIETVSSDTEINSAKLRLKSYGVGNNSKRKIMTNTTTLSSYSICLAEAIKIYGSVSNAGDENDCTYVAVGSNEFNFDYTNQTKTFDIVDGVSLSSEYVYFFYTVEFSNDSSTYYQEYSVTSVSGTTLTGAKVLYNTPTNDTNDRYFYKDPLHAGNSSCFEGLSFTITELEISVL